MFNEKTVCNNCGNANVFSFEKGYTKTQVSTQYAQVHLCLEILFFMSMFVEMIEHSNKVAFVSFVSLKNAAFSAL